MNKLTKWGIVGAVTAGLAALAIHTFVPQQNEELSAAPAGGRGGGAGALNVRAVVMGEQSLTDGLYVSGSLVPDEEVSLTFETAGKITEILFREGSQVAKGDLLAKINDAPLQAQLRRQQAQVKLMQDRVYRAKALLAKEAVSQEAVQEAEANLQALQADALICGGIGMGAQMALAEAEWIAKDILAAKDITLDIQEYSDYVVPNNIVDDGTVDANYFQHQPYLPKSQTARNIRYRYNTLKALLLKDFLGLKIYHYNTTHRILCIILFPIGQIHTCHITQCIYINMINWNVSLLLSWNI